MCRLRQLQRDTKREKVAYARIVCSVRPSKKETHRTRLTVGGNVLDYEGEIRAPTADLITLKLLLNSVISTPKAKHMTVDIKKNYLTTELKNTQCMFMQSDQILEEIIKAYDLHSTIHYNRIYM